MMATFAMTFTGCKKDEEEDNATVAENTWVIDGTVYELATSLAKPSFSGATLGAIGSKGVLSIAFSAKPTASGTYTVKSLGSELGANDVSIVSLSESKTTFSTGKSGDVAKITVSGGKVRVEISNIEVEIPSGESTVKGKLSANILEN